MQKWKFGGDKADCDELFEKVVSGEKTATCSRVDFDKAVAEFGEFSILTNFDETKEVVLKTTKLFPCKFKDITKEHAIKEGDGSLKNWRKLHKEFFTEELGESGKKFSEEIMLTCEEFEIVDD